MTYYLLSKCRVKIITMSLIAIANPVVSEPLTQDKPLIINGVVAVDISNKENIFVNHGGDIRNNIELKDYVLHVFNSENHSGDISNQFIAKTGNVYSEKDKDAVADTQIYADAHNLQISRNIASGNIYNQFIIETGDSTAHTQNESSYYGYARTYGRAIDNYMSISENTVSGNLVNEFIIKTGESKSNTYSYSGSRANNNNLSISGNTINLMANTSTSGDLFFTRNLFEITTSDTNATSIVQGGIDGRFNIFLIDNNIINFDGIHNSGDIHVAHNMLKLTTGNILVNGAEPEQARVYVAGNSIDSTYNTLNIGNNAKFNSSDSSIYGGSLALDINGNSNYTDYAKDVAYNLFLGNTLNYSSFNQASFKTIANFQYYRFTLDPAHANSSIPIITVNDIYYGSSLQNLSLHAYLDDYDSIPSEVSVVGIHSGNILHAGDEFILINANNAYGDVVGKNTRGITQLQQGISLLYDVDTTVREDGKKVVATIVGCISNCDIDDPDTADNGNNVVRVNPQLKSLSEGKLASSQLVFRGADMIADEVFDNTSQRASESAFIPFGIMSNQYNRYDSGSHINAKDFLMTAGMLYQNSNMILGAFFESAWSDYSTYNRFYNAKSVKGDGDARYYGMGLLSRYDFMGNNVYAEGSIRFGHIRNKFHTGDIQNFSTGETARYSTSSHYYTAHVGLGHQLSLGEKNSLDLSTKYLFGRIAGDKVKIAGDMIKFNSIYSHRIRLNATLNHQYDDNVIFSAGLGYEHEFNSKAKAITYNTYHIDAPSVKGSTGLLSIGVVTRPSFNKNLSLEFKAEGYVGKRRGGKGNITLKYAF